jgi:signal transduction histidine kinase
MAILRKHYVLLSTLVGAIIGYLVFHPVSDLVYTLFEKNEHLGIYADKFSFHIIGEIVKNTWSLHDLPDALVYIFLSGLVGYFFGLIIQEHHKIEEQLKAFSAIGKNTSLILHDLGSPVTGIIGFARLAKEERRESVREDYCNRIMFSAESIARMMLDIKTVAQGSRDLNLSIGPENLKMFIDDVAANVRPRSSLSINVPENIVVLIDGDYFERVLWNLFKNADEAAYGKNGGKIEVSASYGEGVTTITICDNGRGFPKELSRKIFTLGATFGKKGGSGMGLYNCKKIMEAHGGGIHINSKPGKWTSVTITLPADNRE